MKYFLYFCTKSKDILMEKLGYIISNTKIRGIADFIELTTDPSYFNTKKPVLIVGLETARATVPNFSILKKNSEKDKFWTFGKTERRVDYERDVEKFYRYVIERHVEKIKYYYVDITKLSPRKIKNFLNILKSPTNKHIYIYGDMLYLYHEEYVLGISLKMLKYAGINTEKHLKRIYKNKNIKFYYDDKVLNPYIRQYSKNKKYLVPFFLSLME